MNINDEMIDLRFVDMQSQIDDLRNQLIGQMEITLGLIKILKEDSDR